MQKLCRYYIDDCRCISGSIEEEEESTEERKKKRRVFVVALTIIINNAKREGRAASLGLKRGKEIPPWKMWGIKITNIIVIKTGILESLDAEGTFLSAHY